MTSSRVSSNSVVSEQLVAESQPGIEEFLTDELGQAIATEVDRCVVNGSGVAPQPQGILALPVNRRTRMFTTTSNEALRDRAPARECRLPTSSPTVSPTYLRSQKSVKRQEKGT